jgi:hypothetical protein
VTWAELVEVRPDLAAAGRRMLDQHQSGLGYLATIRSDGGPRVHPICPVLTASALFAMVIPGPKLDDLRRDAWYALHCETFAPPNEDDGFYVTGTAVEVTSRQRWDEIADQMLAERGVTERWPGFDDQILLELRVERCLLTLTHTRVDFPAGHTIWHAGSPDPRPAGDIHAP